jgi:hypothetical protein
MKQRDYKSIQVPGTSKAPDMARKLARILEQESNVPCSVCMYQAVEVALQEAILKRKGNTKQ